MLEVWWKQIPKKLNEHASVISRILRYSKKGYDLDNGMIIEERYIEDYQRKNGQDKWKFCQENNDSFTIKCKTTGSFLKAIYDYDADCIKNYVIAPPKSMRF